MITTIVLAAALADIESLHKAFDESEQLVVQECIDQPETCNALSESDVKFVESLEGE